MVGFQSNIDQLKELPGIGDYTSTAIMAIVFNKQFIPLDGNVERILKRVFYLKTEKKLVSIICIKKNLFLVNQFDLVIMHNQLWKLVP